VDGIGNLVITSILVSLNLILAREAWWQRKICSVGNTKHFPLFLEYYLRLPH